MSETRIGALTVYRVPTVKGSRTVGSLEVAATTPAHARAIVDRFYADHTLQIRATTDYFRIRPKVKDGSNVIFLAEIPNITMERGNDA